MYKKEITLLVLLFLILCCFMFGPISNIVMDTYEKYSVKLNESNENEYQDTDNDYYYNNSYTNDLENEGNELDGETTPDDEKEEDEQKEEATKPNNNTTTNSSNNSIANNTTSSGTNNKPSNNNSGNSSSSNSGGNSNNNSSSGSDSNNNSSSNNGNNSSNDNENNTGSTETPQYSFTTPVNKLSISVLPGDNIVITSNGISYTLTGEMAAREKIPTFSTTSYLDLRIYSPKTLTTDEYENMKVTLLTYVNGKTYTQKDNQLLKGLGTNNVYFELTQQFVYGKTISVIIDWGDGEEMTYNFTFNVKVN